MRRIMREAVRDVVREELSLLARRNAGHSPGADESYLSVTKAARLADVAPGTVRAWIRAGRLTAKRAGRVLRVSRAELDLFMRGEATGPNGVEARRRAAHLFGHGKPLHSQAA